MIAPPVQGPITWPRIVTEPARLPWCGCARFAGHGQSVPAAPPPSLLHRRRLLFGAVAAGASGRRCELVARQPRPAGTGRSGGRPGISRRYVEGEIGTQDADAAGSCDLVDLRRIAPVKGLADLDLVLAIDTTGSMGGVINDVKANSRS